MERISAPLLALAALASACASTAGRASSEPSAVEPSTYVPRPLAAGESGIAVRGAKLLTMDAEGRVFDPGMVVVRAGRIEYAGAPVELPPEFPVRDVPGGWIWPGMVDLHSHVHSGGSFGDLNDMVVPTNPELRSRPTVRPSNPEVRVACAAGVTTLFGIPGSGTSMSGFGVLYKTKTDADYEDVVLRDPGGLKVAQNFNPQRGGGDLGASWAGLGWLLEKLGDEAAEGAREGREDPSLENLMSVFRGELPVLIHCASAEGVADTVRMWKGRWNTNCVVSHGSWDGYLAGPYAARMGVPVNHGPRTMNLLAMRREDRVVGTAAEYVDAGVPLFSLNTDAPVMPQEELFLQASMSARLGADPYAMLEAVTTNPARSFMIGDRVGSLEPGKDGDVVVSTGDPLDPRTHVELVLIDGQVQYSRERDGQWF
jgi:imidazolonepropionase-like amidohydrolase